MRNETFPPGIVDLPLGQTTIWWNNKRVTDERCEL